LSLGRALGAALLLALSAPARAANPDLNVDFKNMAQWMSHELAQGLAFNAGSTFDPPREVKGYFLQPDLSLGVGRIPFDKSRFPEITTPALRDYGGSSLFPDSVNFPNLAIHLRMGLPWRGDVYARWANATTPAGYKISPTMTAKVQTNSFGFGLRQHFFGSAPEQPMLTMGAHYNHVKGSTRLRGSFPVDETGFTAGQDFFGALDWNLHSYGLTAVVSQNFERWTPFGGVGYNYAAGSVRSKLEMKSQTFLIEDVLGEGSEKPEKNQGRWIAGIEYARRSWSLFANAELKAIGHESYETFILHVGVALPFEIGGRTLLRRRGIERDRERRPRVREEPEGDGPQAPLPATKARFIPPPEPYTPKKGDKSQPDFIFLQ